MPYPLQNNVSFELDARYDDVFYWLEKAGYQPRDIYLPAIRFLPGQFECHFITRIRESPKVRLTAKDLLDRFFGEDVAHSLGD